MSKMTEAVAAFKHSANEAGGSHLTREARIQTGERFARTMHEKGYQVRDAESVKLKHLQAYVQHRLEQKISLRTIQNEISHVRGILKAEGREVSRAEWSNKALGIAGASRDGTNRPATREDQAAIRAQMNDPGLKAMVSLARELGLREAEAIRSGSYLAKWEADLKAGAHAIRVVEGTKGNRPRDASPANRERAIAAVREARAVVEARGGRLLEGTLKQAHKQASNAMHRSDGAHGERVTWHSFRYAYAQDRVSSLREAGYTEKQAHAYTSTDLGHGDGRGAYVAQVYTKGG